MKKFLAIALFCFASSAHAIPITDPHDIDDDNQVGYSYFTVTSEGWFDVRADNDTNGRAYRPWYVGGAQTNIDPVMYIFRDVVSHSTLVAFDDDDGLRYNAEIENAFLQEGQLHRSCVRLRLHTGRSGQRY